MKGTTLFFRAFGALAGGTVLMLSLAACSSSERKVQAKGRKSKSNYTGGSRIDTLRSSGLSGSPLSHAPTAGPEYSTGKRGLVRQNVPADFNPDLEEPQINPTAYVDPNASVIGNVQIGSRVYVAPFASARGDEGQPIHIGDESNLQDGVVIHALETVDHGKPRPEHTYLVHGKRYAVYIGDRVSLAHQSHVHGPAWIEDDVFLGMQALVFKAHIRKGSVVEPAATVIGVTVPEGRYVKAGSVVTDQKAADRLPRITASYAFRNINKAVVHVNTSLADGYSGRGEAKTTTASAGHGETTTTATPAGH